MGVLDRDFHDKGEANEYPKFFIVTLILGAILGLLLVEKLHGFTDFILPFAAGNFIYIAASNLLPETLVYPDSADPLALWVKKLVEPKHSC